MKVLAVIGVTVFVVSASAQATSSRSDGGTPKTVLWRITSDSSLRASYLLGTVHSRDDRAFQWGDSLVPAMHSVDLVAGELDLEQDQRKILSVMPMAMMPGGRSLQSLYRKREWKEVNAALQEKLGYMVGMVSRVKPFFVILMMSGSEVDGPHEHVLDETIMRMAGAEGKEVIGLETMQEQMAALDVLPLDRQARLLLEFVRSGDEESEMDAMLDAYAAQDLDELMRVMEASPTMPTEMDASLIVERNKRMAHRMDSIMVDGTCGFFAVGAGHLPRGTGIIALLRARGYRVEPVFSSYTKPKEPKLPPEEDKDR
ncbi:MAG: TraB/GumN family protein [Flavobacteriales bacterium]|nr:TraB/GumN family protein [Flavobacteriales bacterium]